MRVQGRVLALAALLLVLCGCRAEQPGEVSASLDLRKYGYRFVDQIPVSDYTEMAFLSEDLLAICVNQRVFLTSPATITTDQPNSKVLVFHVASGRLAALGELPVRKYVGAFHAISNSRLAILNASGLRVCTEDLRCDTALPTTGPVFVSPQGTRIAFGGNGMTPRKVFDVVAMKEIRSFDDPSRFVEYGAGVIPGDHGLLISQGLDSFLIEQPMKDPRLVEFDRSGDFSQSRFLNDDTIAYISHGSNSVTVAKVDGSWIRRYSVEKAYRTGLLTTAAGTRFGIYESGFTFWNSLVNFPDIDGARPANIQRVRVIEVSSGDEVAVIEWNPRSGPVSHTVTPQLSPSGHLLARVSAGTLEVLKVR